MSTLKRKLRSRASSVSERAEARDRFDRILARLNAEFKPANETEKALVEMLSIARWCQVRLWGYEKAALAREIEQLESGAAAFRSMADNSRTLDLLNRYDDDSQRMFLRSHRQLLALKSGFDPGECETNLDVDLFQ
jgi:hypothetical protein